MTIEVRLSDLVDAFPWAADLPEADRVAFARDFARTFQTCATNDDWSPLAQTVDTWATAATRQRTGT